MQPTTIRGKAAVGLLEAMQSSFERPETMATNRCVKADPNFISLQKSNDYNKIQNIDALLTPEHHLWTRPADKALYWLKRIQKV